MYDGGVLGLVKLRPLLDIDISIAIRLEGLGSGESKKKNTGRGKTNGQDERKKKHGAGHEAWEMKKQGGKIKKKEMLVIISKSFKFRVKIWKRKK